MDQIIATLQQAWNFIDAVNEDVKLNEQDAILDKLTILIDQFQDAKKWVDEFITHNTEGESVTHLVEDPSGGEGLANPPATEEDNLKELNLEEMGIELTEDGKQLFELAGYFAKQNIEDVKITGWNDLVKRDKEASSDDELYSSESSDSEDDFTPCEHEVCAAIRGVPPDSRLQSQSDLDSWWPGTTPSRQ